MRIGFDFDNTIVDYNALFYHVALELGAMPDTVAMNKLAVRDYLRAQNREAIWTEMQGLVYGSRILEAKAYPAVVPTLQNLAERGHTLAIMSHKTQYPYLGPAFDLHKAARNWVACYLNNSDDILIQNEHLFFETSKEKKLARIQSFQCDIFIDDLPEILLMEQFPPKTRRILFDPEKQYVGRKMMNIDLLHDWAALGNMV